jgi:hypothetical protein
MVLADQFLARILADGAELIVHVGDGPLHVGGGDDGVLVQRKLLVGQILKHPRAGDQAVLGGLLRPRPPGDLFFKLLIDQHQAGQRHRPRGKGHEHGRSKHRDGRGCALDYSRQHVVAMPDIPDFHQVGGAASQNERSEHPENRVERQFAVLTDEIHENDRNGVVRQRNQTIGNNMQPDQPRVPQVAVTVRHEIVGRRCGSRSGEPERGYDNGDGCACLAEARCGCALHKCDEALSVYFLGRG